MENIDERSKARIISIITALIPNAKIILFGSRARGTHGKFSDIDLALDAGYELPITDVDELRRMFEASNLIYKVEVVDIYQVSETMREAIKKEGALWK